VSPDYVIFMDGGCTANPGRIAVATVVCSPEGEVLVESARDAGEGTNNVAEYRALMHAISLANLVGAREPMFISDSKVTVQQVNGYWAINGNGERTRLHGQCSSALMKFDRWILKHVGRERNKRADWLVSKHLGHSRTLKTPPTVERVECDHEGRSGWSTLAPG
jgi:ribonuclease HI